MKFTVRNEAFQCLNCGAEVAPHPTSCRNHCPKCLFSRHLDAKFPGDRASPCHGLMEPFALQKTSKKGWQIWHRCQTCGYEIPNMTADDDNSELLIELSTRKRRISPHRSKKQ